MAAGFATTVPSNSMVTASGGGPWIFTWIEGTREDNPTRAELREFHSWVSLEIESALARHQPTRDLIGLLNAAREELHSASEEE